MAKLFWHGANKFSCLSVKDSTWCSFTRFNRCNVILICVIFVLLRFKKNENFHCLLPYLCAKFRAYLNFFLQTMGSYKCVKNFLLICVYRSSSIKSPSYDCLRIISILNDEHVKYQSTVLFFQHKIIMTSKAIISVLQ